MHFMLGQTSPKVLTNPRYRDKITTNDLQKNVIKLLEICIIQGLFCVLI